MIRLSRVLSLFTTRNSISPLRSSMTAGYAERSKLTKPTQLHGLDTYFFRKRYDEGSLFVIFRR